MCKKNRIKFLATFLLFLSLVLYFPKNLITQNLNQEEANYWFQNGKYFFEKKHDYFNAYQCFKKAKELIGVNDELEKYLRKTEEKLNIPSSPSLLDKDTSEKLTLQAIHYYEKGNKDKALNFINRALLYNPQNKIALEWKKKLETQENITLKKIITTQKRQDFLDNFYNLLLEENKSPQEKWNFMEKNFSLLKDDLSFLIIYLHYLPEIVTDYKEYLAKIEKLLPLLTEKRKNKKFAAIINSELRCLYTRLLLEKNIIDYNSDVEIFHKITFFASYLKKILALENIPFHFTFPQKMEVLDLKKLHDLGYLEKIPKCLRNGIYFLGPTKHIECSFHGIDRDLKLLSQLHNNPYKRYSDIYFKDKQVNKENKEEQVIDIDTRIKSLDLAREYARKAEEALNDKDLKKALELYQKAYQLSALETYLLKIAQLLFELGNLQEAEEKIKDFIIKVGNTPDALSLLGKIYLQKNDLQNALKTFSKLLPYKKDDPKFYLFLGDLNLKAGNDDGAVSLYKKGERLDDKNFLFPYKIGYIYLKNGDWKSAKNYFLKTLELTDNQKITQKLKKIITNLDLLIERKTEKN